MPVVTGGTWGEQSARRLGGLRESVSQSQEEGTNESETYPAFINARLAHVALDVAKLISALVNGRGCNRGSRSMRYEVVLRFILQLLMAADGNACRCALDLQLRARRIERSGRRRLTDGRGNRRGYDKVVQVHVVMGRGRELRLRLGRLSQLCYSTGGVVGPLLVCMGEAAAKTWHVSTRVDPLVVPGWLSVALTSGAGRASGSCSSSST